MKKEYLCIIKFMLAFIVVLLFYLLTFLLMKINIPKDSSQVIFMLFGSISTAFGTIIAYYFGSSQGSEDKTNMIHKSHPINREDK